MYEFSKYDWKLYNQLLPKWQEQYMQKLNLKYINILRSNNKASTNFWTLEKQIKKDRKSPGVITEVTRSTMLWTLLDLIDEKVITAKDLVDFSEELKDAINQIRQQN